MSSTLGTKILGPHHQPFHQPYQSALIPIRRKSLALEVKRETCSAQVGSIPVVAGCDEERKAAGGWWANSDQLSTFGPAKDAFEEALPIFKETLAKDEEWLDLENATTMEDVVEYTNKARKSWEDKPRWERPRKWLERFSERVTHYGKIMDVLVQHHPEYTSLVWGAMKFLFVLVINHQTSVKQIAKTLIDISDSLPRVNLLSILYPSDKMRNAVAKLYARILTFLRRATSWYRCNRLTHISLACWKPFEMAFKELIEDLHEDGRRVNELADTEHKVETRKQTGMLEDIREDIKAMAGVRQELDIRKGMPEQARHIQVMAGNDKFFDSELRNGFGFWPSDEYQKELFQVMLGELRHSFAYTSPGFENLKISGFLGLPVKLDFRGLPKALGRLAVELKETATAFSYQIAFIFCSNEAVCGYLKSPVDLAKLLVFHVLEHNPHLLLEQRNTLPMRRLQTAQTFPDFLDILKDILRFIPSILFVIDSIDYALSTVTEAEAEGTSNDIQKLNECLISLARSFENSVDIKFTPHHPTRRFSTTGPLPQKHTTKLHLDGGMVSWIDKTRDSFPLPRFRSHTCITQAEVAPQELSDEEPFLGMTTSEGGSISAGRPNMFPLPKRPSWPSNIHSIMRHKCKFEVCRDPNTNEHILTTAKFPHISGGW